MEFGLDQMGVPGEVLDHIDLESEVDGSISAKENIDALFEKYPQLNAYRARDPTVERAILEEQGRSAQEASTRAALREMVPRVATPAIVARVVAPEAAVATAGVSKATETAGKIGQAIVKAATTPIVGYERVWASGDEGEVANRLNLSLTPAGVLGIAGAAWILGVGLAPATRQNPTTGAQERTMVFERRPRWKEPGANNPSYLAAGVSPLFALAKWFGL